MRNKLLIYSVILLFSSITLSACSQTDDEVLIPEVPEQEQDSQENEDQNNDSMESNTLNITVNGQSFTATLVENSATEALKQRLAQNDINVNLRDYGDMEKVGSLGFSLPANDQRTTTRPGDIVLYQGNSIVIFYGSNTWAYTVLAKVDHVSTREEMLELLGGKGDITLTLSLNK